MKRNSLGGRYIEMCNFSVQNALSKNEWENSVIKTSKKYDRAENVIISENIDLILLCVQEVLPNFYIASCYIEMEKSSCT